MKKLFVSVLAVAAAVVACQKNETIALDNGEAIAFGNAFVENSVRADYSSTDITAFKVYGTVNDVNIFDGDNVTKGDKTYGEAWALTDAETGAVITQYWVADAQYKFAAVVDANNVNTDANGMPASLEYAAADKKDMLYNYVERKNDKSIVGFTFTHLLAKAYFTVTNNIADTKYTYTISNVQVTNAYQNGVYTIGVEEDGKINYAKGSWTGSNPAATDFGSIENVANGTPKTNAEVLLIPTASVGVSFTVTLYINGEKVTSYPVSKTAVVTLAANSIYNFNVVFEALDQIQFTVTAKPNWGATTTVPAN